MKNLWLRLWSRTPIKAPVSCCSLEGIVYSLFSLLYYVIWWTPTNCHCNHGESVVCAYPWERMACWWRHELVRTCTKKKRRNGAPIFFRRNKFKHFCVSESLSPCTNHMYPVQVRILHTLQSHGSAKFIINHRQLRFPFLRFPSILSSDKNRYCPHPGLRNDL